MKLQGRLSFVGLSSEFAGRFGGSFVGSFACGRVGRLSLWALLALASQSTQSRAAEAEGPGGDFTAPLVQLDPSAPPPFWAKSSLRKRLRDDREVLIAVRQRRLEDKPDKPMEFTIQGAGLVRKPLEHCFRVAQDYQRLRKVSDHFDEVRFESEKRELMISVVALGYRARMILRVSPERLAPDLARLNWEVIAGEFKGLRGVIGFQQQRSGQTLMSIDTKMVKDKLPLPRILMGFALEVIGKAVAERMRKAIETED